MRPAVTPVRIVPAKYRRGNCDVEFSVLIDKSHKRWGLLTGTLFALSGIAYWFYVRGASGEPRAGSVPGLCFGVAGSALMIFAGLIAARKRVPKWRIGSAQFWLRGHLWLGTLSVPLILFHAGFRWGGLLEQLLLLVLAGVVASGAFGLVLQQVLPRQMTARVPLETFYAQIPHVCDVLQIEGDVAVADVCGPLSVVPNTQVATIELLDRLGVKEKKEVGKKQDQLKDKGKERSAEEVEQEKLRKLLASVYEPPRGDDPAVHPAGNAEAAMLEQPTKAEENPVAAAELSPSPVESAAPSKAMSASDKIALMRAKKQSSNAEETLAVATERAPTPAKAMSAADKIAMMRAKKQPSGIEPTAAQAVEPIEAPQPAKVMSAAEKIALMKAKIAPAGGAAVAPPPPKQQSVANDAWKMFCPELKRFYLCDVRPFLQRSFPRGGPMVDESAADGRFAFERLRLPPELYDVLDELSQLCEERRQLATQARIHHWLHGWLFVHVGLSMALLGLGAVHAVISIYY